MKTALHGSSSKHLKPPRSGYYVKDEHHARSRSCISKDFSGINPFNVMSPNKRVTKHIKSNQKTVQASTAADESNSHDTESNLSVPSESNAVQG